MEPITTDLLKPVTETKLPDTVATSGVSNNLISSITASSALNNRLTSDASNAKKDKESNISSYQTALEEAGLIRAKEGQYAKEFGVPGLEDRARKLDSEMLFLEQGLRDYKDKVYSDPNNTKTLASRLYSTQERQTASTLANLAIVKSVVSGDLETARGRVKDKIANELAPIETKIQGLEYAKDLNKDFWSDAQKREVDSLITNEKREYDKQQKELQVIEDEKLSLVRNAQVSGASDQTLSAILNSKTVEEAYKNAGRYGVSIDDKIKQAKLDEINSKIPEDVPETDKEKAVEISSKIQDINSLINNKLGLKLAVGPTRINRTAGALDITSGGIGAKQDFIASVEQLVSEETLNSLINAKAKGATFGALSEGELALLKQSASKIGKWAKTDKSGKVVGYEAPEAAFVKELNTLKDLQIKAFEKATGVTYPTQSSFSINPETGNIIIDTEQDDESFWSN